MCFLLLVAWWLKMCVFNILLWIKTSTKVVFGIVLSKDVAKMRTLTSWFPNQLF